MWGIGKISLNDFPPSPSFHRVLELFVFVVAAFHWLTPALGPVGTRVLQRSEVLVLQQTETLQWPSVDVEGPGTHLDSVSLVTILIQCLFMGHSLCQRSQINLVFCLLIEMISKKFLEKTYEVTRTLKIESRKIWSHSEFIPRSHFCSSFLVWTQIEPILLICKGNSQNLLIQGWHLATPHLPVISQALSLVFINFPLEKKVNERNERG